MAFWDEATNFFSGGKQQGAEDLERMLREGLGEMKGYGQQGIGYLSPFRDAGLGQLGTLQQAIARMTNPNQFFGDMMKGYQESPMATQQRQAGLNDSLAAASASGMTGSSDLMRQINEQSQRISNQDQQQYFNNLMGINNQGLGMSQGLYNTGFGAGGNMANIMSNLGQAIAQMYGQIGQAQNMGAQAKAGGISNLISGAGSLLGFL